MLSRSPLEFGTFFSSIQIGRSARWQHAALLSLKNQRLREIKNENFIDILLISAPHIANDVFVARYDCFDRSHCLNFLPRNGNQRASPGHKALHIEHTYIGI